MKPVVWLIFVLAGDGWIQGYVRQRLCLCTCSPFVSLSPTRVVDRGHFEYVLSRLSSMFLLPVARSSR